MSASVKGGPMPRLSFQTVPWKWPKNGLIRGPNVFISSTWMGPSKKAREIDRPSKRLSKRLKCPSSLGGGIRDLKTVESYLSLGLTQVILGTAALKDPALVKEACRFFPGQIMVSLDARDNRLAVEGWIEISEKDPVDLAKQYEDWGVKAIIFTDISRDGTQQGPSIPSTRRLAQATRLPVIAAGGIATLSDVQSLAALEADGLAGMITGRAIYSGSLNLPEAIKWLKKNTSQLIIFS